MRVLAVSSVRWMVWVSLVLVAACGSDDAASVLTAERAAVTVDGETVEVDVEREVTADQRVSADAQGYGTVTLADVADLNFFKAGTFGVPDVDTEDAVEVQLSAGHIHVRLGSDEESFVVRAGERTFTALEPDTEFVLCHNPETGAVCLMVREGSVEWKNADGQTWTFVGQQTSPPGMFAAGPSDPPTDERCGPAGAADTWLAAVAGGEEAPALPALVDGWSSDMCS